MGVWKQLARYFYIRKRFPDEPDSQWMRCMHGINRISIFMFLVAIIIVILRLVVLRR